MRPWGYVINSCTVRVFDVHIEILREAGPQGLHVDAISEQNGVESVKLGSFYFTPPFSNTSYHP